MPSLTVTAVLVNGGRGMGKAADLFFQMISPQHDWILPSHESKALGWPLSLETLSPLVGDLPAS